MKTEKSALKEVKFPAPLNGYIVIANPIIGIEEELKELKKLPDDKKRDYLKVNWELVLMLLLKF